MSDSQLPRDPVIRAIGSTVRWDILKILAAGEPMGAGELGKLVGCKVTAACAQMRVLVEAGLVERGRGRLYRIPPRFQPTAGQPVLDYGHCVLRLGGDAPAS